MTEHLEELANAGFRLIPLRGGENAKKPRDEGYAGKNYTLAELTGNVGLIVDQEHVDVDLDWPETQRLAGLHAADQPRLRTWRTHADAASDLSRQDRRAD